MQAFLQLPDYLSRLKSGQPDVPDILRRILNHLAPGDIVLIHDGARPFVDRGLIERVVDGEGNELFSFRSGSEVIP